MEFIIYDDLFIAFWDISERSLYFIMLTLDKNNITDLSENINRELLNLSDRQAEIQANFQSKSTITVLSLSG